MSPPPEKKEVAIGYLLWTLSFVGVCGVQRMYLGQVGYGIALLFTFGFCGIGQLLDLLLLPEAVNASNRDLFGANELSSEDAGPSAYSEATISPSSSSQQSGDGELDELMREAQESVQRIETSD